MLHLSGMKVGNEKYEQFGDVAMKFIALGCHVTRVEDTNDLAMIDHPLKTFKNEQHRPTLIIIDNHIAYGW